MVRIGGRAFVPREVWDAARPATPVSGSYDEWFRGQLDAKVSTRSSHSPSDVWNASRPTTPVSGSFDEWFRTQLDVATSTRAKMTTWVWSGTVSAGARVIPPAGTFAFVGNGDHPGYVALDVYGAGAGWWTQYGKEGPAPSPGSRIGYRNTYSDADGMAGAGITLSTGASSGNPKSELPPGEIILEKFEDGTLITINKFDFEKLTQDVLDIPSDHPFYNRKFIDVVREDEDDLMGYHKYRGILAREGILI